MKIFLVIFFVIVSFFSIARSPSAPPEDTLQIKEIVISASRTEVSRRNVPVTISTVDREQIEMSNESAVLPVLSHRIPGMFVTERGVTGFGVGSGSAGQISLRGVGGTAPNSQVLVLIDGTPQFQGLFSHPLPDAYVSSDIEKVEVIRGPASILYGSNAMAGAINIITRKQEREGLSGNARVSYGSFNTQKYMANGGLKKGKFNIFASVNHDRTNGHRDTSDFNIINGYLKAGYQINDYLALSADFNMADFKADDPGSIQNPAFFGIDITRGKTSFSLKNNYDNLQGGLTAFYNFGNHEFTDGWKSEDYHAGVSLFQGFGLFAGNRITVGADYKTVGGIANRGVPDAVDVWHTSEDFAGYVFTQQSLLNRLIVSAGVRLENNSLFGAEIVPQAGLSYIASESVTLKGSYSKGFRSPSLMELYLFAPNPELKPERMNNYDLSAGYKSPNGRFSAELVVFMLDGDNVILVRPNDAPPPPVKRQNVGTFSNNGVEMEVKLRATQQFAFAANYSYINTDAPRLAAPEHQLFAEAIYTNRKLRANLSVQQISGLITLLPSETFSVIEESYTLLNLMVSYRFTQNIEIFASGKNLLDQQYTINYGYPMPGMNFMTGLNVNF
jgi:iron complex outermembrane receptor protein